MHIERACCFKCTLQRTEYRIDNIRDVHTSIEHFEFVDFMPARNTAIVAKITVKYLITIICMYVNEIERHREIERT